MRFGLNYPGDEEFDFRNPNWEIGPDFQARNLLREMAGFTDMIREAETKVARSAAEDTDTPEMQGVVREAQDYQIGIWRGHLADAAIKLVDLLRQHDPDSPDSA